MDKLVIRSSREAKPPIPTCFPAAFAAIAGTRASAGIDRQRVVLEIDVKCVETSGLGDLGNLDRPGEAYCHRRHELPPAKLFLVVVAQDRVDFGHVTLPKTRSAWGQDERCASLQGVWERKRQR